MRSAILERNGYRSVMTVLVKPPHTELQTRKGPCKIKMPAMLQSLHLLLFMAIPRVIFQIFFPPDLSACPVSLPLVPLSPFPFVPLCPVPCPPSPCLPVFAPLPCPLVPVRLSPCPSVLLTALPLARSCQTISIEFPCCAKSCDGRGGFLPRETSAFNGLRISLQSQAKSPGLERISLRLLTQNCLSR